MNIPASPADPSGDDQPGAVLSPEEAAAYLSCNRKTIYQAIARGELPHLKLGRRLFISRAVLDRMLEGEQP